MYMQQGGNLCNGEEIRTSRVCSHRCLIYSIRFYSPTVGIVCQERTHKRKRVNIADPLSLSLTAGAVSLRFD